MRLINPLIKVLREPAYLLYYWRQLSREFRLFDFDYRFLNGYSFPPKSICLILTEHCNLQCAMCDIGQKNAQNQTATSFPLSESINKGESALTLEHWKQLVDDIVTKQWDPLLLLTGTEPFLYPQVTELIDYIVARNLRLHITTNGTLLSRYAEALVDLCTKPGSLTLTLSLDGIQEVHDSIRGVKGTFERAIKGLNAIDERKKITQDSEEYEFIEGIIEEANRISKIIGDFSEFSKMGEETKVVKTNLLELISKVEKLLAYNIRHSGVKIIKELDSKFPYIYLPQYRLQHIMFNLLLNSIQSLSIKYNHVKNSLDYKPIIKITAKVRENEELVLKFYDNGEGIPDENMVKIFEPFFTTRRNKVGSGLGLYQVYNIIQDLNGAISVDSVFGEWTEFQISLPIKEPYLC